VAFDPRVDAARGDLADLRLADRIFAPHYAAAVLRTVIRRAIVRTDVSGEPLSEVLPGETFEVLELARGHAWGVSPVDGVVGFVESDALAPYAPGQPPSPQPDVVAVAESLIGIPVAPGGRSDAGVDAGGFLFLALSRAGHAVARFIDLQATSIGDVVEDGRVTRGDLLFTDATAAIALDGETAIHVGAERVERVAIAGRSRCGGGSHDAQRLHRRRGRHHRHRDSRAARRAARVRDCHAG
jgi:hypothetical protein